MPLNADELLRDINAAVTGKPGRITFNPEAYGVLRSGFSSAYHFDFADLALSRETFMGMDVNTDAQQQEPFKIERDNDKPED